MILIFKRLQIKGLNTFSSQIPRVYEIQIKINENICIPLIYRLYSIVIFSFAFTLL